MVWQKGNARGTVGAIFNPTKPVPLGGKIPFKGNLFHGGFRLVGPPISSLFSKAGSCSKGFSCWCCRNVLSCCRGCCTVDSLNAALVFLSAERVRSFAVANCPFHQERLQIEDKKVRPLKHALHNGYKTAFTYYEDMF